MSKTAESFHLNIQQISKNLNTREEGGKTIRRLNVQEKNCRSKKCT